MPRESTSDGGRRSAKVAVAAAMILVLVMLTGCQSLLEGHRASGGVRMRSAGNPSPPGEPTGPGQESPSIDHDQASTPPTISSSEGPMVSGIPTAIDGQAVVDLPEAITRLKANTTDSPVLVGGW